MNEQELLYIFRQEKRFLGTFACDELCFVKLFPGSGFIFNTSPRCITNGHWIAVYMDFKNVVYFVDSLRLEFVLHDHYVSSFLKYNNIPFVKTLNFPIQPINSNLCGLYCIYFLKGFYNNLSFTMLVDVFETKKELYVNDFIVSTYILK